MDGPSAYPSLMVYVVVVVDLRKRFEQEPINTHVEATSTVQLQCLPPSGLPTPQVGVVAVV